MNLCSDNHEEICFESRKCPMCAQKEEHEEAIREMDRKLEKATEEISELESRLSE